MSQNIDLFYAFGLKPEAAIKYFQAKGYALTWNWFDLWRDAHAKAFTVAKVARLDVLQDIKGMIQKSLDEGITFQQFKNELTPMLQSKGWWGKVAVAGENGVEVAQLGSPQRLKTIYQTNLQSAYMEGRRVAFEANADDRPYWQYVAVLDARTRPDHAALNGKVFRYDDPFWDEFYPPWDYNCRCRVRALDEGNLRDRGLSVEDSSGSLSTENRTIGKTGEVRPVTVYTDQATGRKSTPGIGWESNPGDEWQPDLGKYDPEIAALF